MKKIAIISDTVRRDLQQPLQFFSKFEIVHLYHKASYGDMKKEDFSNTQRFENLSDLRKKLKKINPDIVQAPEPYGGYGRFRISLKNSALCYTVFSYCVKNNKKYFIPVFENLDPIEKYGPFAGGVAIWLAKKYCRRASLFFCMNGSAVSNVRKLGISQNKIVRAMWAVWGVNLREFRPGPKEVKPTILFAGRLEEKKGVPDLIKAFEIVQQKIPEAHLIVAGDGALRNDFDKLSNVEMLGVVKHGDVPKLFAKAWLTVSPSVRTRDWAEQVGMVNIQSICCQTPVVSTDSGSISEYMRDSFSVLVPEHSPELLAKEMIDFISDAKKRRLMGEQGLKYAKEHYDAEKNIFAIEKVLLRFFGAGG